MGTFEGSYRAVNAYLPTCRARKILVGAINDQSALGALRAFREHRRLSQCAVIGQNATADARLELRTRNSRLIGSVAYFPEKYGEKLISLALDVFSGKKVRGAVYTKHELITARNVNKYYPTDGAGLAGC